MRKLKWMLIITALIAVVYLLGPHPEHPRFETDMPVVTGIDSLDAYVAAREHEHQLKKNNEARILWYDSSHQKTDYAIVYLHGFSASQEEGNPVHRNIASAFGCNLYLSRLSQHGIDTTEQLLNLTADNYWASAKEALAIGKQLGSKVILMGTSTGATLALQLAAAFPKDVAAIVLYSPNIEIKDDNARLLNNPWGLQIARLVQGGKYFNPADERPVYKEYWNKPYRLEALVALEEMMETTMVPETFRKIHQPALMLYYYKDETHQDNVIKISAAKKMFESLATPSAYKKEVALSEVGDHVIASPIKSKDIASVEKETTVFFEEILKMKQKERD